MVKFNAYKKNAPYKSAEDVSFDPSKPGSFVDFVHRKLPVVKKISAIKDFDSLIRSEPTKPHGVLLVKSGGKPVSRLMGLLFKDRFGSLVEVEEASEAGKELIQRYGVMAPTAVVVRPGGENHVSLHGEAKRESLKAFFELHALPAKAPEPPPLPKFYVELTEKNFDRRVMGAGAAGADPEDHKAWFVLFAGPEKAAGEKDPVVDTFNDAALQGLGYAEFGVTRSAALAAAHKVTAFPSALFFGRKAARAKPVPYKGSLAKEDEIVKFLQGKLPDSVDNISVLNTPEDLQRMLTGNKETALAPKFFLFTNKEVTGPLFKALALAFPKLEFAEVRSVSGKAIIEQMQVKKFPLFMSFRLQDTGKKDEKGQAQLQLAPTPFQGQFKFGLMRDFVATHSDSKKGVNINDLLDSGKELVPRVDGQKAWDDHCTHAPLCIVFAFSGEDEFDPATGKPKVMEALEHVAAKSADKPLSFVWINADKQTAIVDGLGFGQRGFPAAAAINARKKVIGHFVGAFNKEDLLEFASSTLTGGVRIGAMKGDVPKAIEEESSTKEPKTEL